LQIAKIAQQSILVVICVLSISEWCPARESAGIADSVTFVCRELLGRPTDNSIELHVCADKDVELLVEYGTQHGVYGSQSPVQNLRGGTPTTLSISPLSPNTRYYYRVRYRTPGTAEFLARDEHTFHTARFPGSAFVFAIEADPHLDASTNPDLYRRTIGNILNSSPDFLIDLGDNFMSEKLSVVTQDSIIKRHLLLRSFYDLACHSVPLMLAMGNHEGELGWLFNGTANNLAVWTSNTRKLYFPNPVPGTFYSGDTTNVPFVGQRQNFYAWEWGNGLFVVLDPYWYTTRKPGSSQNNWDWTLGRTQYEWFKSVLEKSSAPFKFVFAHQIIGGIDAEGRGGIEGVPVYEMGGLNADGSQGFAGNRPGWFKPIHQLMAEHHVSAYFHGHDHVFVKQELDGIVYQEMPQPGYFNFTNPEKSYSNIGLAAKYGYTHGVIYSSSGYVRVTVADTGATVEYVRSYLPEHENSQRRNGEVAYSYVLRRSPPPTSVERQESAPHVFGLFQNYPNPFNPSTVVSYQLSAVSDVKLAIYDLLGREVAVLVDEQKAPGRYEVPFDGSALSSGTYFYRLKARDYTATRVMSLIR
jgi:hypothetical protein